MPAITPPPWTFVRAVVVVHAEACERRDLQERRAAVEQVRETLARSELAALLEHGQLGVGGFAHAALQRAKLLHQRQHVAPVGLERLRLRSILDCRMAMVTAPSHRQLLSSRCLSPGSISRLAPALADGWIPGTRPRMTNAHHSSSSALGGTARWKPWKAGARSCGMSSWWRLALGAAPSTRRVAPETKAAAGDSRNTMAAETSASVPRRCSGRVSLQRPQHRLDAVGIGVEAGGRDPARRHRVDPHAGAAPLRRRRHGEVHHPRPRGAAVPHARHAVPHVGHDIDDGAAVARASIACSTRAPSGTRR